MLRIIAEAFLLGISVTGQCSLICAPFLVPQLFLQKDFKTKTRLFLQFMSGRFLAYLLFAIVFSAIGIIFSEKLSPRLNGVLMIIAASLLLVSSVVKTFPKLSLCSIVSERKIGEGIPFVTGFILGLNLCPPFIVGLVRIMELKSIFLSCVFFVTLFIGTSIYLVPLAFAASAFRSETIMRLGQYLGFLVGIWFLIQGVILVL